MTEATKTTEQRNKAFIIGRIVADFEYSHSVRWERFYKAGVRVERKSGTNDIIPIVVSYFLIGQEIKSSGRWAKVVGQLRSRYKLGDDGRNHLEMFLFVKDIKIYKEGELPEEDIHTNSIYLDGYIDKPPVFRKIPVREGQVSENSSVEERQISDLKLIVKRGGYGKTDYIPVIAWGRKACWAKDFKVGDRVQLLGRIQSREYFKKSSPDSNEGELRTTYEVSAVDLKKVED